MLASRLMDVDQERDLQVAVIGLLERKGEVRTMVVEGTKRSHLHGEVVKHVETGSTVYTDALRSYNQLDQTYIHKVINHAEKYVDGIITTNGVSWIAWLVKYIITVETVHVILHGLDHRAE